MKSQTATPGGEVLQERRIDGWTYCQLGDPDVSTVIMGQSPDSETYNVSAAGLPFFQGKADFGIRYPSPRIWCSAPTRVAEVGDILVSVRAPVGDANIARERCCIGRGIAALRSGSKVHGEFLFYSLLHRKDDLDALGSGAIFKAINKDTLRTFELDLPPLAEQRAIAGVLAKIQAAVEMQERIVATIKELKAATMAKLFREGLRGEPLKQTEIGEIPQSWEVVGLGEVARIERGKFAHRPRNDPRFYGGSIPFIQTGDVAKSNGWIRTYTQTLNETGLAISRVFPKGTIVLTIAANIADTAILEFDSAFPDSLVGITPNNTMAPLFLRYYLQTQKTEMDRLAPKGTQKNINIQFVRPWPVPRPSLGEQQEIAHRLRRLDERLESALARLATLKSLFSSMLHLLMTGRVRVTRRMIALQALEDRMRRRPKWSGKVDEMVLEEIVRRIIEAVAPEKIILFGSAARGEMGPDSDLDLLVVKSCENRREVARAISERLHGIGVPKDVLVVTPEDVEEQKDIPGMTVRAALREGKVLYAG